MSGNKPATCRSCGAGELRRVLSLGALPLANALLTRDQLELPEPRYPLECVYCPGCALVQITETVPPEQLFRDYVYFSSFSDTVLASARSIAERLIRTRGLRSTSRVVEIASNDGYLLQHYARHGIPVLGVEPARNIARTAEERGIPTVAEFFDESLGHALRRRGVAADVLHANNVIAHVADLHGVLAGIRAVLGPDGLAVIENHYVKDLIDHVEFDSIYHEHLCYFSVTSFEFLFRQHGMILVDVERLPLHGGSLRVFFQLADGPRSWSSEEARARVDAALREEASWGVRNFAFYEHFGERVERLRAELTALLSDTKAAGKRIAVYGASAKSSTLLNYFHIGADVLDYVVDRSTVKQGRYTPGTRLPIHSPQRLLEDRPDYVLLLTWNFADEILEQQAEYRRQGGRFIIPIPQVRVV